MSRKLVVALLVLLHPACSKSGVCHGKDLLVEISGNHDHNERIVAAALARGAGNYKLEGGSHEHTLRLSEATIAKLETGDRVELRSSSQNGHLHELRLSCEK